MAEKLGILVSSDEHLDYVINLTKAAHKKGKEVEIFFTGKGVLLTQSSDFKILVGKAKMTLCDVSFRALKLEGDVPGLGFKDFATQAKNADLIDIFVGASLQILDIQQYASGLKLGPVAILNQNPIFEMGSRIVKNNGCEMGKANS
jgi:hypothetical protein